MAHSFELACQLESDIDTVWSAIERPALFLHVAAPLVGVSPIGMASFPETWAEQEYRANMRLLGALPIGWQAIVISYPAVGSDRRVLHDNGYGPMLKTWSHEIEVEREGSGTLYCDRVSFDAGLLTPIAALSVRAFFAHRQRRLRGLDRSNFRELILS